ncbi:MAG: mandelate racemase/muconate lactonizing enzyme family protein [Candidatus Latescibacterota bacterium]|nr:mandelate racemase/muconate lactonizing enzyme family protein [Candidatus Latescibacterota bacterium]
MTDQGLVGLCGYADSDADALRARVLGKNPFDPEVRADVGMAYWDLAAKLAELPLCRYLARIFESAVEPASHVPTAAYTWARFPDLDGEHAVDFDSYPAHLEKIIAEDGFEVIKLSLCDFEPPRCIDLIHNIREALGPDVTIRVDPHASWSESQALKVMKSVEDCDLEWIEEPVGGSFENIFRAGDRLRRMSTVPISSHAWLPPLVGSAPDRGRYGGGTLECPVNPELIARYQPADISAPDAFAGPLALKRYYDLARFCGMDIGMHSAYELGPGTAIRLHIAAWAFPYDPGYHIAWGRTPAPFANHAIDAHYNQWVSDIIRGGKMKYERGFLAVPQGPGLGTELDPELLDRYRWTEHGARTHIEHIGTIRCEHTERLGWRRERTGWPRWS